MVDYVPGENSGPNAKGSRAGSSPAPKLYISLKIFSINPPPNRFKFLLHEALC